MSVRTRILGMVDVIMRVPPLFVIDEILKNSMGLPMSSTGTTTAATTTTTSSDGFSDISVDKDNQTFILGSTSEIPSMLEDSMIGIELDFHSSLALTALKFIISLIGNVSCLVY